LTKMRDLMRARQMLFKCASCIYMTEEEAKMATHTRTAHQYCPRCAKLRRDATRAPRIFVCDMCEGGWTTEWNHEYYKHMEVRSRLSRQHEECLQETHYSAGPPHRCDRCAHTAVKVQHILAHRLRHTLHKPVGFFVLRKPPSTLQYKCAYAECTYACRLKASLVAHQRQHTGERPFNCTQVTWRAKSPTTLCSARAASP